MAITLHTWDTRGKPALERIIGEVFPENLASARVLEKNGFLLEETRAGAVVKGGKAMDVRVYVKEITRVISV